jgi:hypothetical protein
VPEPPPVPNEPPLLVTPPVALLPPVTVMPPVATLPPDPNEPPVAALPPVLVLPPVPVTPPEPGMPPLAAPPAPPAVPSEDAQAAATETTRVASRMSMDRVVMATSGVGQSFRERRAAHHPPAAPRADVRPGLSHGNRDPWFAHPDSDLAIESGEPSNPSKTT